MEWENKRLYIHVYSTLNRSEDTLPRCLCLGILGMKYNKCKHCSWFVMKSGRPVILVHQVIVTLCNYKQTVPKGWIISLSLYLLIMPGENPWGFSHSSNKLSWQHGEKICESSSLLNLTWYDQRRGIIYQRWDLNVLYLQIIFQKRDQQVWGKVHQ